MRIRRLIASAVAGAAMALASAAQGLKPRSHQSRLNILGGSMSRQTRHR